MPGPLRLHFKQSAPTVDLLPLARAEVAFAGRSNVGKSSLLNALAARRELAFTSKTPGATRLLNVFEFEGKPPGRWVVDLPGYGFARVSHNEHDLWQDMIERYLTERPSLRCIYVLVDGEVGPTPLDLQMVEWVADRALPFRVVATKVDKVGASHKEARRREVADRLELSLADLRWVSAVKGIGIAELRNEIASVTADKKKKSGRGAPPVELAAGDGADDDDDW